MGELMTLLRHLDPQEAVHFLSGEDEVKEMLEELGIAPAQGEAAKSQATVGSLIKGE